jgi:hypothetical protein
MIDGLQQAGSEIPLKTAVSILVASIIYLSLMLLIFKVAGTLTRSWRLGRAPAIVPATAAAPFGGHQERPLNAAPAAPAAAAIGSDRVRSAVASVEVASSSRLPAPAMARLAMPAPAPVPSLPGPSDARSQLRYLHHRVAGVSNNVSREMLR